MSHGLQADISYTYSRSIDFGSGAERATEFSNGVAFGNSSIINTWSPAFNRGVSDFDTAHLITVDWVYQLPFGGGAKFLSSANGVVNGLIGGWQLSGIMRATSGLPFSVYDPGWTTDWQQSGNGVVTGKIKTRLHFDQNGSPQFFHNSNAINQGLSTGGPIDFPIPARMAGATTFAASIATRWRLGSHQ